MKARRGATTTDLVAGTRGHDVQIVVTQEVEEQDLRLRLVQLHHGCELAHKSTCLVRAEARAALTLQLRPQRCVRVAPGGLAIEGVAPQHSRPPRQGALQQSMHVVRGHLIRAQVEDLEQRAVSAVQRIDAALRRAHGWSAPALFEKIAQAVPGNHTRASKHKASASTSTRATKKTGRVFCARSILIAGVA